VLESKRDTFIMFYSPWCGFCKSAMPVFDQVAAAMISGEAPLTVARFDVSRNRLPHGAPQITKLPTIYYIFGLDNSSSTASDDAVETSQKVDADFESDSDEAISQRLSTFINERKRQAENSEADAPKRRRPTALESRYQLFNSQRSFESLVEFASDCAARARSESILPATIPAVANADMASDPAEPKIDETPAPAAPVDSPDLAVAPQNEAIPQHRVHDEL
jgi:thiol-disulfide isomerase/thioredoxin